VLAPGYVGCAASARLGGQSKLLDGQATAEAQGTLAVGGAGDHAGNALFLPVLSLSGGVIPATQRGTGAFEGGVEYATSPRALPALSLRVGPRVGGTWGGQAGSYGGVRGGVAIALEEPGLDRTYPVVVVEALAAPGFGGDLAGTFVGGLGVSFGFEKYGSFRVPSGRPMRHDGRAIVASVSRRRAWRDAAAKPALRGMSRALRRTVGHAWLREARFEHASIATFASLSMQLLACGAPPDLVAGAHHAALDEVHHAKLCFALAAAYLDEDVDPGPLPATGALKRPTLTQLACESLADGALGEGSAAMLATRRRGRAEDPAVKRVLGAIAREERRHAELAWSVLAWAARAGGPPVAAALGTAWAREQTRASSSAAAERGVDLSVHGLPTARDVLDVATRIRRRAGPRLAALLGGAAPVAD